MFRFFDKFLLDLHPPSESNIFNIIEKDIFETPTVQTIIEARQNIEKGQYPVGNDMGKKEVFMWEIDILVRYILVKLEYHAKEFNKKIEEGKYGEQEVEIQMFLVQGFKNLFKVLKKGKRSDNSYFNKDAMKVSFEEIIELCKKSSNIQLLMYLVKLREQFNLQLPSQMCGLQKNLAQTNNIASLIDESIKDNRFGQNIEAKHFQLFQYRYNHLFFLVLDFEKLDQTGNSYVTIVNILKSNNVDVEQQKKQNHFRQCVFQFTFFKAIKQGIATKQYTIAFVQNVDSPLFQYRYLQSRSNLSQQIKEYIENKIARQYQTNTLYSNNAMQEYFFQKYNAQYQWVLNYPLQQIGFYDQQYKNCLVRNIFYSEYLAVKYETGKKVDYERYYKLMPRIYVYLNHVLNNPEKYDKIKLGKRFQLLNFDFDKSQCQAIWEKLKKMSPIHKNIVGILYSIMQHCIQDVINQDFKNNPHWKLELYQTNKSFLIRVLAMKYQNICFIEEDIPIFQDLLKNKDFKLLDKTYNNFIESFKNKGWLVEQIKSYSQQNIFYYSTNNKAVDLKISTAEQRANILCQKVNAFKNQRQQVNKLRQNYKNTKLNQFLFENFECINSWIVTKAQKILSFDMNARIDNRLNFFMIKSAELGKNSLCIHDNFSVPDQFELSQILLSIGQSVLNQVDQNMIDKMAQIFKYLLESSKSLQQAAFQGKFTIAELNIFIQICNISKIGSNFYDNSDAAPKIVPSEQQLILIENVLKKIINITEAITYVNFQCLVEFYYKNITKSQKIDAQIKITSSFSYWQDMDRFEMDFHKKGTQFMFRPYELGYNLSRLVDIQQEKLQGVINKIYNQRFENEKAVDIKQDASDQEMFLSLMKNCLRFYFWKTKNFQNWNKKNLKMTQFFEKVCHVSLDEDKYFMVNHVLSSFQQFISEEANNNLRHNGKTMSDLTFFLEILFKSSKLTNFSLLFQKSQLISNLKQFISDNIKQQKLKQKQPQKSSITNSYSYTPLKQFILNIYYNINNLTLPSSFQQFFKNVSKAFKEEQTTIQNYIIKYLNKQQDNNLQTQITTIIDVKKLRNSMDTYIGLLNSILKVNNTFKNNDLRVDVLCNDKILNIKYSQAYLKLIQYLELDQLKKVHKHYLLKVQELIRIPNLKINRNELLWVLQIVLYSQSQIVMYFPQQKFEPEQFVERFLKIYNADNQLGDISMYIILQEISYKKYRYNMKKILMVKTMEFAKNNYYELEVQNNFVTIKSIGKVLAKHQQQITATLPLPYSNPLFFSQICKEIIDGIDSQLLDQKYSYLSNNIISKRLNYTQTNLFLAIINLANTNPHIIFSIFKQIPFSVFFQNIQSSEGYLISIIYQLSFYPAIFYQFIDSLLQNSSTISLCILLNLINLILPNFCNIINYSIYQKSISYLSQLKELVFKIFKRQPLSRKFFKQLKIVNITSVINKLIETEYKLKIFAKLYVYPGDVQRKQRYKEPKYQKFYTNISIIPSVSQSSQIESKPLNQQYLFFYQFNNDSNRKPQQINSTPFPTQTFTPSSEQNQQTIEPQQQDTETKKQSQQQEYDEAFVNQINYNKNCDADSKQLIKYLKINRQEFMDNQDKWQYMKNITQQLFVSKRKAIKKILTCNEILEFNGEAKIDLEAEEKILNEQGKILDKLNFTELTMLKGLKILKEMKLDKEIFDIINNKKKKKDDDEEENQQQKYEAEKIQQKVEQETKTQEKTQEKVQEKVSEIIQEKKQQKEQKIEQKQQQKNVQQSKPQQPLVPIQDTQLKNIISSQQQTQNINNQQQAEPQQTLQNLTKDDKIQIIQQYSSNLKIYESVQDLPDEIICFLLYDRLNQKQYCPDYRYYLSSEQNFLKFANLLMRVLSDNITGAKTVEMELFRHDDEISSIRFSAICLQQFQKLEKMRSCLFIDTNSTSFTLSSYNSTNYSKQKDLPLITFNPVQLFGFPKQNISLISIISHLQTFFDFRSYDIEQLYQKYLQIFSASRQSFYNFHAQQKNLYEIVQQNIISFAKLSLHCIVSIDSNFYMLDDITFTDEKMWLQGTLLEVIVDKTIESLNFSIQNMKYLKQTGNIYFNSSNTFQNQNDVGRKFNSGSMINSAFERIKKRKWFQSAIFVEAYSPKLAILLKTIYDFRRLFLQTGDEDQLQSVSLQEVEKCFLSPQLQKLKQSLKNSESQVNSALQFNPSSFTQQIQYTQNDIDKMLLQQISTHGQKIINQTQVIFSLSPEILHHFDITNKAHLYSTCIFDTSEQLELSVHRDQIIMSTVKQFSKLNIKKITNSDYSIKFIDEVGIDGGGLMNEYVQLFVKQLSDCSYGLFTKTSQMYLAPSKFAKNIIGFESIFRTIGRILGKCVGQNLLSSSVELSPYIIKLLYGQKVGSIEDMKEVDQKLYENLNWILQNDVTDLEMTFEIINEFLGIPTTVQLIQNGKNITVTNQNKKEYIQKYIYWFLIDSVKQSLYQLILGFKQTCPTMYLRSVFTYQQFQRYVIGQIEFDIELYKKTTKYHNCNIGTTQIKWLFEILEQMTKQEIVSFLVFVTGMKRLPAKKFQDFQITCGLSNDSLPTSNTCSNKLNLGAYKTKQIMKNKLDQAIKQTKGFHVY